MEAHNNEGRCEISAAIDFGTTYSGVAYSYRGEENKIYTITNWSDGSTSSKVPTAILFDENEKFVAFGQDAVDRFVQLADEEKEKDVYFFHRFKMQLYTEKIVTKNFEIQDVSGKNMKALVVFSAAIEYLKKRLLSCINDRYPTMILSNSSLQWVLTVPAIWNDASKQFMREAAEKAGLNGRNLTISLEPECASMYCFNTSKEKMVSTTVISKENSKYLVLDNGGGTVDITAHQVQRDESVKELYKASGGAWGGTKVDELFIEYLYTLFTRANVEEVKKENPSEWQRLLQDFESVKRKINKEALGNTVSVGMPGGFDLKNFKRVSENAKKGATIKASRLKVSQQVFAEMISRVSKDMVDHVNGLLKEHLENNIDFIVMVGGFSNSSILVSDIKTHVTNKKNIPVLVPEEAEMAVMKGAVLFGWDPRFVRVRKARKTYGFRVSEPFKEGVHPESRAYINDFGEKFCKGCFDVLVKVNEDVEINETKKRVYSSPRKGAVAINFPMYCTEKTTVAFTDEEDVIEMGKLSVPSPITSDERRHVDVGVIFGDTELKVKAHDQTSGEDIEATFNIL